VTTFTHGNKHPCAEIPQNSNTPRFRQNYPPYVLFPFQESRRDNIPIGECIENIQFKMKVTFPQECIVDIESAIWAWVNFGGIGARTRRGCGALYCKGFAPQNAAEIGDWYSKCLNQYRNDPVVNFEFPTLPDTILIKAGNSVNPLQNWSEVINVMKSFRQGVGVGRNAGTGGRPGRSRWPEAESIRNTTGSRSHSRPIMRAIPTCFFPRSEFGLPIVFHFKDFGDPINPDPILYPVVDNQEKTRMSSPLILRPLKCLDNSCLSIILKFKSPLINEVCLHHNRFNSRFTTIRDPSLSHYLNSPMNHPPTGEILRSANGSALEAFIAYAIEKGYTEVS
jgi:CRISPR-associated protein Cmr1